MAWAVKYKGEFRDLTYLGSTEGLLWTVDIEEDGFTGTVGTLLMADPPLTIEHLTPGDDLLLSPIKGSRAVVNVWSETHFQYTGLYSSENFKYRVSIYYGDTPILYWRGYLTSEYQEPYDDTPYMVSITASDGLGLLKDVKYDNAGVAYDGRDYESEVILNVLGKLGVTSFSEFCNLYDTLMDSAVSDSPFDQSQIDEDVFAGMYCYDVLVAVLKKFNAVIRQSRGVFWIYRPTELDATVNYRTFTAYNTKTNSTFNPDQYIHRNGQSSAIKDFHGGVLMLQSPISEFRAVQDYGYKESWIENYKFGPERFDPVTNTFEAWTIHGGDNFHPLQYRTGEPEGLLINPVASEFITQVFGGQAKQSASDVFRFEFDYKFINATGAAVSPATFAIALISGSTPYYLKHPVSDYDTLVEWTTTISYLTITVPTVEKGEGQWQTWTRYVTGLPEDGTLQVVLYSHPTMYLCINNVRFYATSDNIVTLKRKKNFWQDLWADIQRSAIYGMFAPYVKTKLPQARAISDVEEVVKHTYTATNAIEAPKIGAEYILGDVIDTGIDNVMEQFKGALSIVEASGGLVATASQFVIDHFLDYAGGAVALSSSGPDLIFESSVTAQDFTGASTCVNATGNLAGTVVTTQANVTAVARVDHVNVPDVADDYIVLCDNVSRLMNWDTNLATTITAFVAAFGADYDRLTVDAFATYIKFTANTAGVNFIGATELTDGEMNTAGSITYSVANRTAKRRKDTITLIGTGGTATVTVDAEVQTATWLATSGIWPTTSWHTRGNTENKPVIELVADEVVAQYARERHFIQANLRETSVTAPDINVVYGFKDTLNRYGSNARLFACNRGTLDVKSREWSIDLHEII